MNNDNSQNNQPNPEGEKPPTWTRVFEYTTTERDLNERDTRTNRTGREYYDEIFGEGNWKLDIPRDDDRTIEDAEHAAESGLATTAMDNALAGEGYHVDGSDMTGRVKRTVQEPQAGYIVATDDGMFNRQLWLVQHEKPTDN